MSSGRTLPTGASSPDCLPTDSSNPLRLRDSERVCRRLAKSHYENFLVASILLPRRIRQPFYNIYAFCRTADDLADESPSATIALERLDDLQRKIADVFNGHPPCSGMFPALAHTITTYGLHRQPFEDLISAFRQDQHITDYDTTSRLIDYCTRSANPVGHLVLQLAGSLNASTRELSDDICTGLQLANFWQDVARDHRIGRTYLPGDLREAFGVTSTMIAETSTPQSLRNLMEFLCDQAEGYLRRGLPLADHVPSWLSGDIKLFAHGGLATLDSIRRIDFDILRVRPTVSKRQQMTLVARAFVGRL
jgi:squalene synthase HpnC